MEEDEAGWTLPAGFDATSLLRTSQQLLFSRIFSTLKVLDHFSSDVLGLRLKTFVLVLGANPRSSEVRHPKGGCFSEAWRL